jgi:transcription antitermination factor NusA-like protein
MIDDINAVLNVLAQTVPEIEAGAVKVEAVARKAGYRIKIVLQSRDASVDCVAVCVGLHGERIKRIADAFGRGAYRPDPMA